MYDNYNYPAGADEPNAPWNQSDPEPVEVEVTISQSLSRSTTITVTDYTAEEWEDVECDEDGIEFEVEIENNVEFLYVYITYNIIKYNTYYTSKIKVCEISNE